jgi:hypothetical protein
MKTLDVSTPKYHAATALVDDEDYPLVSGVKWHRDASGYIARNYRRGGRTFVEYMHRRILGEPAGIVDHANGDRSDNRRSNLRVTNSQGNAANMRSKAKCGLKGVTAHPGGWFRARIMVDGKQICLGLHATPEAAHAAYMEAARHHFGDFASAG